MGLFDKDPEGVAFLGEVVSRVRAQPTNQAVGQDAAKGLLGRWRGSEAQPDRQRSVRDLSLPAQLRCGLDRVRGATSRDATKEFDRDRCGLDEIDRPVWPLVEAGLERARVAVRRRTDAAKCEVVCLPECDALVRITLDDRVDHLDEARQEPRGRLPTGGGPRGPGTRVLRREDGVNCSRAKGIAGWPWQVGGELTNRLGVHLLGVGRPHLEPEWRVVLDPADQDRELDERAGQNRRGDR